MKEKNSYVRGILLCLIATISWGGMFPVMTSALKEIDPFTFTAFRYTIALIAFSGVLIIKEGVKGFKTEKKFLVWLLGTFGFAGFGFLAFLGQKIAGETGALTTSTIMASMPLLGLFVNWGIRKVRPPFFAFIFVLISFVGILLVLSYGNLNSILNSPSTYSANLIILAGALCWVIYTVGASLFPNWSPYKYTTLTTLYGLISIFIIVIILLLLNIIEIPSSEKIIFIFPHLAYMSLIAGFLGVLSWNMGNKIISSTNGVLFMDIVPITSFIISALTGVIPKNMQIIGMVCTASALVLNNLFLRKFNKN